MNTSTGVVLDINTTRRLVEQAQRRLINIGLTNMSLLRRIEKEEKDQDSQEPQIIEKGGRVWVA